MNSKSVKLLCIFETLVPKRDVEVLKQEYSDTISKEILERIKENEKEAEEQKAIEGGATEETKGVCIPEKVEGDKKDETTAVELEKKEDTPAAEDKDKDAVDTVKSIIQDKEKKEEETVVALPEFKYERTYVSIEEGSLTNEDQCINQEKLLVGF